MEIMEAAAIQHSRLETKASSSDTCDAYRAAYRYSIPTYTTPRKRSYKRGNGHHHNPTLCGVNCEASRDE